MYSYLVQNAGTFAVWAAIASIISMVALFIFFAVGGVFGPINDVASVFQMLFLIPVALVLHQVFRQSAPAVVSLITIPAILAMLLIAVLQGLLVIKQVRFDQTLPWVLAMGGVVGLWWLVGGLLSLGHSAIPAGLAWAGIISGLSFIAVTIGFWIGGQEHPLAAAGFLVGAVSVPVWGFWLGRLLNSGLLTVPA